MTTRILAERLKDGVLWRAFVSNDRGWLQVCAVVPPSVEPTIVELLTDSELRELLAEGADQNDATWRCAECGVANVSSCGVRVVFRACAMKQQTGRIFA